MKSSYHLIARRYANSLFLYAQQADRLEEVFESLKDLGRTLQESDDLRMLMASVTIDGEKKRKIWETISKNKVDDITIRFVNLLIARKREKYVADMINAFTLEYNKANQLEQLEIKLSATTPQTEVRKITQKIQEQHKSKKIIEPTVVVDPALIGGFVITYSNHTMLDLSLKGRLDKIKEKLQK